MEESNQNLTTMPIPYDLPQLLTDRPSPLVRPWTPDENSTVVALQICKMHCEYGEWGTDEDWELLEPLFDGKGNYLG